MIFMNRFSRSSRPTGPKMRVPRGSPPSRLSPAGGAQVAGPSGAAAVTDQHGGVLVEADVGAIRPTTSLGGTDDDGLDDVALLDAGTGQRVLDRADDDVADAGVAPTGAAEHPDAKDLLGPRVV